MSHHQVIYHYLAVRQMLAFALQFDLFNVVWTQCSIVARPRIKSRNRGLVSLNSTDILQ